MDDARERLKRRCLHCLVPLAPRLQSHEQRVARAQREEAAEAGGDDEGVGGGSEPAIAAERRRDSEGRGGCRRVGSGGGLQEGEKAGAICCSVCVRVCKCVRVHV